MLLELAKKINTVSDGDFRLIVDYDGSIYSLGVFNEILGVLYSMSSTKIEECYERINKYIESLEDNDKFFEFVKEVSEKEFEVV